MLCVLHRQVDSAGGWSLQIERPDLWPAGEQRWVEEARWGHWWVGHCSHDTLQPGSGPDTLGPHRASQHLLIFVGVMQCDQETRSRYVELDHMAHYNWHGLIHSHSCWSTLNCLYFISEILFSGQNEWYDIIFYIWVTWYHGGPHRNRKVIIKWKLLWHVNVFSHVTKIFLINLLQASLYGLQRKRQWKFCLGCDL